MRRVEVLKYFFVPDQELEKTEEVLLKNFMFFAVSAVIVTLLLGYKIILGVILGAAMGFCVSTSFILEVVRHEEYLINLDNEDE